MIVIIGSIYFAKRHIVDIHIAIEMFPVLLSVAMLLFSIAVLLTNILFLVFYSMYMFMLSWTHGATESSQIVYYSESDMELINLWGFPAPLP